MTTSYAAKRAGRYIRQPTNYRAFIPAELPPDPPIRLDPDFSKDLSDADRALGRLDGVASVLPNSDLFVAMYVKHEAVFSSQIEGTQSTLEDVLEYEAGSRNEKRPKDVEEVVNYVRAMNHGLRRLGEGFPLSLRLLREIHSLLLLDVRGGERTSGEFRKTQNWIGQANCTLDNADFVPPPPHEMHRALDNLEKFLYAKDLPTLVLCGVAHAQFETVHPFLDGNGRIGRLLITLLLCERGVLRQPLLYLSYYLKARRAEYYDRLTAIRMDGDWEGWMRFFLRGVREMSEAATETARGILNLRREHRLLLQDEGPASANALRLLDLLYEQPIITIRLAEDHLDCTYATASSLVDQLEALGLLREITGQKRNRIYRYDLYLELFDRQAPAIQGSEDEAPATTESDA